MHIKHRRARALLYRSVWVPKGSAGNTHGYSRQVYVGSLPASAEAIPGALRERMSDDELAFIDAKICAPAKEAAERQRMELLRRERDPSWRVAEATRLIGEAVARSAEQPVSAVTAEGLRTAFTRLHVTGSPATPKATTQPDPLAEALAAVSNAAQAVASGRYGQAPKEQVRTTRTYRLWAELFELVQGENDSSLLRSLQAKGFVKKRGG